MKAAMLLNKTGRKVEEQDIPLGLDLLVGLCLGSRVLPDASMGLHVQVLHLRHMNKVGSVNF